MTITRLHLLLSLLVFSGLVLIALVSTSQSGIVLSASIPRFYSVPKWQCNVACKCSAPSMMSEIFYEPIGTTSGQETICALINPSSSPDPNNLGNYGISSTSNCTVECLSAFPHRNDVRGAPIISSRQNCQKSGVCRLPLPATTTPTPGIPVENPFLPIKPTPS